MDELVIKAQNIEEDIKEMPLLEKIKYAANLYQEMTQVSGEAIGDMNVYFKAKSWVEMTWRHLVAELKSSQKDELAKRVSEARSCSIGQMFGKEDPQVVDVQLSEQFSASIIFKWSPVIRIEFSRSIQDGFGGKTSVGVVIRWKVVPEWLKQDTKFVRGHFEKEVTLENWVDMVMATATNLIEHKKDVVSFCRMSSNSDDIGNLRIKYKTWKTKGRILSLRKELPVAHVYHAKKREQLSWDHAPGVHGSNGTYVENVNPFWCLTIKIKRPSFEAPEPIPGYIDIHDYVTKSLMPKLEWGRITQDRLDRLNEILKGVEMELVTSDTTEAALYRNFLPIGFKSWDEYLDSILLPRL